MKLAKKLKLLRAEKGITQDTLIKETGLSAQAIRNYENEDMDRLPNTVQLKILKDYFGVTYEFLLDDNCENKTPESVNIGKKLKLSDQSLNRITDLQNHNYQYFPEEGIYYKEGVNGENSFNRWLESFDEFKRFSIRLDIFYNLNKLLEITPYFMHLSDLSKSLEDSFNSDKVFISKINDLLDKKIDEYKSCFEVEDKSDFLTNEFFELTNHYKEYKDYLNKHKKIPEKGLFLILDYISSSASIIYEDAYKNLRYCQYEISEIIKNNLINQSASFDENFIPSEIKNILKKEGL